MDLRRRLARLDPLARKPDACPALPDDGASASAADEQSYLRDLLELQPRQTGAGPVWFRETRQPGLARPSGPVPDWRGLLRSGHGEAVDWDAVLLLDTETSGLAGGTGTLAFLVGLAWWEGEDLVQHQLFLAGPHREAALLEALAAVSSRFRVAVTYNGATFDLPLLRTRALLGRRPDPCGHLIGWDLLTAARRLWGRGLPDCRQQTVERHICGLERGPGDIPGALIPATYHAFLRGTAPVELAAVLRHNRRDLAGLGRILGAVAQAAHEITEVPRVFAGSACESWSRALVGERRGDRHLAAAWARQAAEAVGELPINGLLDAVRLLKRVGDWSTVASLLDAGLDRWPEEPRLHHEAAILYEHRLSDWPRALSHATALGDTRRQHRLRARLERARLRGEDLPPRSCV